MRRISYRTLVVCLAPFVLAGCDRAEERAPEIPAGVSVGQPRGAAETGSLTLPGQEPEERVEATQAETPADPVAPADTIAPMGDTEP